MSSISRNILSSFAAAFTQERRILQLRFGPGSGIANNTLLPHRLTGSEHLSQCYRYDLDCLTADGRLDPEAVFGQPVQIEILQADGKHRTISGLVTSVEQRGANGGFARLGLIIEPALAALGQRFNSRIFQDKTVPEIAQALLDKHLQDNPAVAKSFKVLHQLRKTYQPRSYCNQYRESDLTCFERLLAEEGISYRFTFSGGSGESGDTPLHTLVLFDDAYVLDAAPQQRIRFHRADATEREDSITEWQSKRQLHSGKSALASFDYKAVSVYDARREAELRQGKSGQQLSSTLEDYDPQAPYYGSSANDIDRYARLRQQAKDMRVQTYNGQGTARSLQAGAWFRLDNHPVHEREMPEQREFIVTALTLEARNNLTPETKDRLAKLGLLSQTDVNDESRPYANRFTAVRRSTPIVPLYSRTQHAKPTAPGLQTATVVGPRQGEIHTNESGYIKVRFHWQRPEGYTGSDADWEAQASTWVRVAYPSAGARWGHLFIPRVGQEVLIAYLEGDMDRPLCVNALHNGTHQPPSFSGVSQLPADRNLSGIKTEEINGWRYNQLRLDDTTEQISAQLMSLHAQSELNLGWLGTPRQQGKSEPRGEGFELTTEAAGAIRAARSLLLTAEQQQRGGGAQLMRSAAIQSLSAALALVERIGDEAAEAEANQPETGRDNTLIERDTQPGAKEKSGHQTHLKEAVGNLERSFNNDPKGQTGQGDQRGGQGVVVIASPEGTAVTSQKSVTVSAGTNLDQVAQRDLNQTSGRRWIHNIAESASLFVSGAKAKIKATFKITVAKGNMLQRVLSGEYIVEANGDIRMKTKGSIYLEAEKGVWIKGESGMIHVGNDIDIHNPGKQSQKASDFDLSGPASDNVSLTLPKGTAKDCSWKNREAASKGEAIVPIN